MSSHKRLLLVGDNLKVKEFAAGLGAAGAEVVLVPEINQALAWVKSIKIPPDGVVFILPVYWESVADFVAAVRNEPRLARLPLIYLGDFIEASDQIILKRAGVHTLTLGPVPTSEAVRYILQTV